MRSSYLPQDYEQLAREHKMVEVQYGNAKIKTAQDLLRFVFVHVGCDLPLPGLERERDLHPRPHVRQLHGTVATQRKLHFRRARRRTPRPLHERNLGQQRPQVIAFPNESPARPRP